MTKVETKKGKIIDTDKQGLKDPYFVKFRETGYDKETAIRHAESMIPLVEVVREVDHRVELANAKEQNIAVVHVGEKIDDVSFALDKALDIVSLDVEDFVKNEDGVTPESLRQPIEKYKKAQGIQKKVVKVQKYSSKKGKSKKPSTTRAHTRGKPK